MKITKMKTKGIIQSGNLLVVLDSRKKYEIKYDINFKEMIQVIVFSNDTDTTKSNLL